MSFYLVINLGLRSIRVIVYDKSANIISRNWYPIQTYLKGDKVEQNPEEWWSLCSKLLTEIRNTKPDVIKNLRSITVTSSASCLVVLDAKGKLLMNSLLVSDKRAQKEAQLLKNNKRLKKIFKKPNNIATASYMIPKIVWIKKHHPRIFKKAAQYLSSNDYLIYKLTGQFVTDPLNAEKFYYDQEKAIYPQEMLQYVGVDKNTLPRVLQIGTLVGQPSLEARQLFGFPDLTQVVISSYDAICAFLGSGVSQEGEANNVCGTVSSIRAFTKKKIYGKNGVLSQSWRNFHMVGGSNNIDGGLLEWSKRMFYGDTYQDKYVYTIMEEEAYESHLGANGLFFLPYIIGERVPISDNIVRGMFFGLERSHSRKDIMRSIFESSGFMAKDIIDHIEALGVKVKNIRMSGGLSLSRIACKIRADITGKTIYVTNDIETTSLGALFVLLITDGVYKNLKQTAKLVKFSERYKPNIKNHRQYQELFKFYKEIYLTNKDLMIKRKKIVDRYNMIRSEKLENL